MFAFSMVVYKLGLVKRFRNKLLIKRLPGVTAWRLIWLVSDQGQRYCYCLAVKRRLCVLQEKTHLYDNQGKNLLCCDILDGNVPGAQLPEHLPDREGA